MKEFKYKPNSQHVNTDAAFRSYGNKTEQDYVSTATISQKPAADITNSEFMNTTKRQAWKVGSSYLRHDLNASYCTSHLK